MLRRTFLKVLGIFGCAGIGAQKAAKSEGLNSCDPHKCIEIIWRINDQKDLARAGRLLMDEIRTWQIQHGYDDVRVILGSNAKAACDAHSIIYYHGNGINPDLIHMHAGCMIRFDPNPDLTEAMNSLEKTGVCMVSASNSIILKHNECCMAAYIRSTES